MGYRREQVKIVRSSILHSKIAPRQMRCSGCGRRIEQGRVYVKTNYGRYCEPCADGLDVHALSGMMSQVADVSLVSSQ